MMAAFYSVSSACWYWSLVLFVILNIETLINAQRESLI